MLNKWYNLRMDLVIENRQFKHIQQHLLSEKQVWGKMEAEHLHFEPMCVHLHAWEQAI